MDEQLFKISKKIYNKKRYIKDDQYWGYSWNEVVSTFYLDLAEDSFYIYEHEPIVSYKLKILEIRNSKAHIQCSGILIVDGYTEPYEQEKFEIDSWIPVIRAEGLIPRRSAS